MRMEELLIEHGAPTLAGLKTANLFTVNMDVEDIVLSLREANRVLNKKGMKVIPLRRRSFIESPYEGVKCSGCWKAYSNETKTKKLFDSYKKCTCIYSRKMKDGISLESLAVRSRKREVFQR